MSSLVGRDEDPHSALTLILNELVTTFKADAGSISLLNPSTDRLETEVSTETPVDGDGDLGLKPGHGITGWCVLNGRAVLVRDVAEEPRYIAVRASARCEMAAPMRDGDQMLGVIDLECDRVGGFDEADLALLQQLADEAARVMQRLWQLAHLRGKARQLEALISTGQSLVSKLEQQELFDTLTRDARAMTQTHACALYLYDGGNGTIRFVSLASESESVLALPAPELPLDSCLVAAAIHTRRQVAFNNILSPEFSELADIPPDEKLRSLLATPVLYEGEVLGVLAMFTNHVHRFDNDEKRLCAALASLGAVALQNARLYARVFKSEDSLRKNERLTTLGLLAAEIAHEIRNPLTVLKLLHGGIGLDFPENDPRRTDMRVIREKLDQLEAIVSRVLNFAKAPSSLHSRWSLADIIEDTLVLVRLKLTQSKIHVRFDPPPLPLIVEAHKGQLQQVLLNLIINATHAMPDGGTITLTASSEERGPAHYARLDLADTGSGIPAEIRDRIFDSFLSTRPDGTGLGLAIAKRILISHHGDIILLHSSPEGTTMRLTLPLAR
ncbi:MAG TPA: GAF domain-containing protein [Opitutaceae bacterium]|nr:GAF domain-containing protein [Opitutaceae bacterium]